MARSRSARRASAERIRFGPRASHRAVDPATQGLADLFR